MLHVFGICVFAVFIFCNIILTTSAVISTDLGSILIFASCVMLCDV